MKSTAIFSCFTLVVVWASLAIIDCERVTSIKNSLSKDFLKIVIPNDYTNFVSLLDPILIKRVSGTPGNVKVRNYIISKMESYGWLVEKHEFVDNTPYGQKSFANIIATLPVGKNFQSAQRNVQKRVVFACHYDSKYFANQNFLGAIDSAVPCAMLLDMAKFFHENFNQQNFNKIGRSIQFLFFDGEEAFQDWTSTDSIYGSRAYAQYLLNNYGAKAFSSMELFVLLDLMGAAESQFKNYFPSTSGNVYNMLQTIENKLIKKGMLSRNYPYYFTDNYAMGRYNQIDDDHRPFLRQNVPILHLIPSPFPHQWHKLSDNFENLSEGTIQDLRLIMKIFFLEVLNVSVTI